MTSTRDLHARRGAYTDDDTDDDYDDHWVAMDGGGFLQCQEHMSLFHARGKKRQRDWEGVDDKVKAEGKNDVDEEEVPATE